MYQLMYYNQAYVSVVLFSRHINFEAFFKKKLIEIT